MNSMPMKPAQLVKQLNDLLELMHIPLNDAGPDKLNVGCARSNETKRELADDIRASFLTRVGSQL